MKTIIAGSRNDIQYKDIVEAMGLIDWTPTVIVSGTARGADRFGEYYAATHGMPVERYPADWNKFGKSAGYIRNQQMADEADALVAVWDGESRGTLNMIDRANKAGLKVYIHHIYTYDPLKQTRIRR